MKLIKQVIMKSLSEYDEGRINKEFPVFKYYGMIQICSLVLGTPIPNSQRINELYRNYNIARRNGDKNKIRTNISQLKAEMIKDKVFIDRFNKKFENINIEDDSHINFYTKDSIGYLNSETE